MAAYINTGAYENNINNIIRTIMNTIMDINHFRNTLDIADPNRRLIKAQLKNYCNIGQDLEEHYTFLKDMDKFGELTLDEMDQLVTWFNWLLQRVQALKDDVVI